MALLELKGLTMRFGGLTAVNKVDFAVEKGQIFSVIGPNGAGKTTVFNAVTGVYEPTEGQILFNGRELRRPLTGRVVAALVIVGLLTGVALAVCSANIDQVWRAVVVLNTPDAGGSFPLRKAARDFRTFLGAGLLTEIEQNRLTNLELREKGGKSEIRSSTNKRVLESHEDADLAGRRLEVLRELVSHGGSPRNVVTGAGRWIVVDPRREILGLHPDEAAARRQAQELRDLSGAELRGQDGKFALVRDGRTLAVFGSPGEAEDRKAQTAHAAEAAAETTDGKWLVLDGSRQFALEVFDSEEKAAARLLDLAVAAGKLRWRIVTRVSPQALATASDPEEAWKEMGRLEAEIGRGATPELAAIGRAQVRERALVWLSLFAGLGLGAGGTFVVWRRARRSTDYISRNGLGRTFQNIRLFPEMLVVENVMMGMDAKRRGSVLQAALHTPGHRAGEEAARRKSNELLDFVGLKGREGMLARNLPYGDQRRLEIARAMATEPALLLLDEPAAGMNPAESVELTGLIRRIRDRGITVLLIEHHMKVVMPISDRIVVLDYGSKIAEGTPAEVRANPRVIEAYLGKEEVT